MECKKRLGVLPKYKWSDIFTTQVQSDGQSIDLAKKCLRTWRMNPKGGRKTIPGYIGQLPMSFLFAHGLWENKDQAAAYAPTGPNEWRLFTCPYYSFNFPQVKPGEKGGIKGSIGQQEDIEALLGATVEVKKANFETAMELPVQERIAKIMEEMVIVGTSRGALTAFNAFGKYPTKVGRLLKPKPVKAGQKPARYPLRRAAVSALIAESPNDTIVSYVYDQEKDWKKVLDLPAEAFDWYFKRAYGHEGVNPISVAHMIDRTLPILIVHSKKDTVTPINSSRVLYYFLQKQPKGTSAGRYLYHPKAFLLELDEGEHGEYHLGGSADRYKAIVNAFYSYIGIPYDEALAQKGWDILFKDEGPFATSEERLKARDRVIRKHLQPSLKEIEERIINDKA